MVNKSLKMGQPTKKSNSEAETEEECVTGFLTLAHVVSVVSIALVVKLSYESSFLMTEMTFEAAKLNNTRNSEVELLFFNRVPKVGSQTIMSLLKRLQVRRLKKPNPGRLKKLP